MYGQEERRRGNQGVPLRDDAGSVENGTLALFAQKDKSA